LLCLFSLVQEKFTNAINAKIREIFEMFKLNCFMNFFK